MKSISHKQNKGRLGMSLVETMVGILIGIATLEVCIELYKGEMKENRAMDGMMATENAINLFSRTVQNAMKNQYFATLNTVTPPRVYSFWFSDDPLDATTPTRSNTLTILSRVSTGTITKTRIKNTCRAATAAETDATSGLIDPATGVYPSSSTIYEACNATPLCLSTQIPRLIVEVWDGIASDAVALAAPVGAATRTLYFPATLLVNRTEPVSGSFCVTFNQTLTEVNFETVFNYVKADNRSLRRRAKVFSVPIVSTLDQDIEFQK